MQVKVSFTPIRHSFVDIKRKGLLCCFCLLLSLVNLQLLRSPNLFFYFSFLFRTSLLAIQSLLFQYYLHNVFNPNFLNFETNFQLAQIILFLFPAISLNYLMES